jgi:hypothetical protein
LGDSDLVPTLQPKLSVNLGQRPQKKVGNGGKEWQPTQLGVSQAVAEAEKSTAMAQVGVGEKKDVKSVLQSFAMFRYCLSCNIVAQNRRKHSSFMFFCYSLFLQ